MQISQLPASNSFSSSDVIAIEINGVTYKLTGATLATALRTIGGPLPIGNGGTESTTIQDARVKLAAMYRNNFGALNLDNMKYNGMGYVGGGSATGLGSNLNGVALTISNGAGMNDGTYGVQFWSSASGNIIAWRRLQNNAWQSWQKVTFTAV